MLENEIVGEILIKIISNSGLVIKEEIISKNSPVINQVINSNTIKPGIYFIEINLPDNKKITQKIIIE